MSLNNDRAKQNRKDIVFNVTLAAVAGQVGCLTLVFVLAALFGGLWLDNRMDTRPMFTVILMAVSVPVTLVMMFWVVRKATSKFQADSSKKIEDENQGGNYQ